MEQTATAWLRNEIEGDLKAWREREGFLTGTALDADADDRVADAEMKLELLKLHQPVEAMGGDRTWLECESCGPNREGDEVFAAPGEGEVFWPCQEWQIVATAYRHRDGWAEHWGSEATAVQSSRPAP